MDGHDEHDALINHLRISDSPAAHARADELQDMYHARQLGALLEDVYEAARHEGDPRRVG